MNSGNIFFTCALVSLGRSLWGLLRVAAEVSCSFDCQWQLTRAPRAFDMVSEAAGSLRGLLRASSSADAATNGACCPSTMEMWRLILVLKKRMLNYAHAKGTQSFSMKWVLHMTTFCCRYNSAQTAPMPKKTFQFTAFCACTYSLFFVAACSNTIHHNNLLRWSISLQKRYN